MERKFNYADLNQVSKKTVANSKRIEEQTESFIKQHQAKVLAEKAAAEAKLNEEVLNNARFSHGSIYAKNKARVQAMQEAVSYTDNASVAVVTHILSTIVENSLLLDVEDFAKLNPNYKKTIKETVSSFLKNGDIETLIEDKRTLAIMEHVARNLPDVKTGIYLKEEELIDIVKRSSPVEINSAIDSLSGDVKARVANIVVTEQDETDEIEKEVEEIKNSTKKPEELEAEQMAAAEGMPVEGEVPAEGMPVEGEVPAEELPADEFTGEEEMVEEMPVEGEVPAEEMPIEGEEEDYLETDNGHTLNGQPLSQPKTSIKVLPSGEVAIDVFKEQFYRETPRQGILESLALNEAKEMLAEGKEYNGDLVLGNALLQLTILETFNVTGLMPISEMDYKKMLNVPAKKKKIVKEELGDAAAEPVHTDEQPKEETPEVENKDILVGQHAEEVKEVVVESWKQKALKALNK
jgi:hypothetical protein